MKLNAVSIGPARRWAALLLAAIILPLPGIAAAQEMYQLEGFQFTKDQKQRYDAAVTRLEQGVKALQQRRYADAYKDCSAAYGTFIDIRIPEMGRGADAYNIARACMGDAQYGLGDTALACSFYGDAHYRELTVRGTQAICQRWDSTVDNHNDYNRVIAGFSGRVGKLQSLPEGSSERAAVTKEIAADCRAMRPYMDSVPPSIGAMGYCAGIVYFERGAPKEACQNLWFGAKGLEAKMQGDMLPEQRRHGERLRAQLEDFRTICADVGYRWPSFSADWPY